MAVALAALDAIVVVLGAAGEKRIPVAQLHRLPGDEPERDTVLEHGDLITAVESPPPGRATRTRSTYRKIRDRASFAFALVSVAAVLELDVEATRPTILSARIALGGVAHAPWRARRAERLLAGALATRESFRRAAAAELEQARPVAGNEFKVTMAQGVMVSVLAELAGLGEENEEPHDE
ncbi:hypothetical protein [Brachybacterium sp. GPGPB12]|uniref:FAD binding domain-containing protein n=1 Tax=Brachybacterium sp. GPGPB12 TaxID=3023517 RepID=UPI0031344E85